MFTKGKSQAYKFDLGHYSVPSQTTEKNKPGLQMQTALFILHSRLLLQVKTGKHDLNRYHGNASHET